LGTQYAKIYSGAAILNINAKETSEKAINENSFP